MEMLRVEFGWGRHSLILVDRRMCQNLSFRICLFYVCNCMGEGRKPAPSSLSFDQSRPRRFEKIMIE